MRREKRWAVISAERFGEVYGYWINFRPGSEGADPESLGGVMIAGPKVQDGRVLNRGARMMYVLTGRTFLAYLQEGWSDARKVEFKVRGGIATWLTECSVEEEEDVATVIASKVDARKACR